MLRFLISSTWRVRYFVDGLIMPSVNRERLQKLKDVHKGKPLLVIGNGPSLNNTPLDDFKSISSIGMNKIDMIFPRVVWRPDYIVTTNSVVVKQHWESFVNSPIPVFLSHKARRFIPSKLREKVTFFSLNSNKNFSTNFASGAGAGETVTFTALQLAYYTGANPVIIFGVDHNFNTDKKDKRKYEKMKTVDHNHFDPNYFKKGSLWGIPDLEESENLYMKSRLAFEQDGRQIYDATIDGKLQVFEKINLNEAKKLCGL